MAEMNDQTVNRETVRRRIEAAEQDLRALGVRRLALFGSVGRDEAGPESDVDLLMELEPGRKSYDSFLAVSDLLEDLLGRRVELVTTEALSPFIGPHILAEAEDVLRAAPRQRHPQATVLPTRRRASGGRWYPYPWKE